MPINRIKDFYSDDNDKQKPKEETTPLFGVHKEYAYNDTESQYTPEEEDDDEDDEDEEFESLEGLNGIGCDTANWITVDEFLAINPDENSDTTRKRVENYLKYLARDKSYIPGVPILGEGTPVFTESELFTMLYLGTFFGLLERLMRLNNLQAPPGFEP